MRLKIALRNLYYSQTIIIVFLIFAYFTWFPHSLSKLGGFNKTAFMLLFVDLILGPLLVYIIFKENKKYLKFDINILLTIQIIAFLFGAYSLFIRHPAYVVFMNDRFTASNVTYLYPQQHWYDQLKTSLFSSPKLVIAKPPNDLEKMNLLVANMLFKNAPDINKQPEFFEPLEQNISEVFKNSIPIDVLLTNENNKNIFSAFYKKHGGKASDYAYLPLYGNNKKEFIWVFNRSSAQPIEIIEATPWILASK